MHILKCTSLLLLLMCPQHVPHYLISLIRITFFKAETFKGQLSCAGVRLRVRVYTKVLSHPSFLHILLLPRSKTCIFLCMCWGIVLQASWKAFKVFGCHFSPVPVPGQFQRNVFCFVIPHSDLHMNHFSITNRLSEETGADDYSCSKTFVSISLI